MTTIVPARELETTGMVGSDQERVDGRVKISGRALYVGDMAVPGMVHGKILRSPVAHARIKHLDVTGAEDSAGVVAVMTAADLADIDPYYGHAIRDRPIVAIETVRFMGEPVAAVAAETEDQAEEALRGIVVEYEDLPIAADLDSALAGDAPQIHTGDTKAGSAHGLGRLPEREGNICYRYALDKGDTEAAFEGADIIVEGEYIFPAVYQYAMETHSVIARDDGTEITVWSSCQHPFLVRAEIAQLFGRRLDDVRIIVPFVGGGFGSKSYTKLEPVTVALARKAGRPVRIVATVDEAMATTRRHGMQCRMRTAATAEGRLLAREISLWLDTGAYADNGPRVTATAGDAAPGPYRWDAVSVAAHCVYTNTAPAGSYRAFGAAHLQWIGESQVDEVAGRCGLDPLEIRRQNLLTRGEEVRPGGKPLDADLVGDVEAAAEAIGWGTQAGDNRGKGVSVGLLAAGAHPVSMATVRLGADGQATVLVGSTEVGQGTRTVMSQIAAEVLGLTMHQVTVVGTDTRFTPYDRSTGASRSTTVAGKAVQRAARQVLDALKETASVLLDADPADLVAAQGAIWYGDQLIPHSELVEKRFGFSGGELIGHGEVKPEGGSGSYAEGPVFWEVCVAAAEVEVDRATGIVRVVQTSSVADVGKAINPLLVERQDEGGTLQGLGNTLFEEMRFDTEGMLLNDTLLDYRVPTTLDVPERMTCVIVENQDGPGPFGAKGCGEGVLAAIPAAVVNALRAAGIPMRELPLTPERVWRRIQELKHASEEDATRR